MAGGAGTWLDGLAEMTSAGRPMVLVTIASVRGHAPRGAGTKMVVTHDAIHGTIGGGDLEARAVTRARELLGARGAVGAAPELVTVRLTPTGGEHGVQCCGGVVTLLLDPIDAKRPTVAVFGAGHVGSALVQVLATLPLRIVLIDSRSERLDAASLPAGAEARLERVHAPVPETAVADLPAGAHAVILTHDHAEDIAILDTALRRADLGYLGLIGSKAKWSHFRGRLREQGHGEDALARVTTPIGLPDVPGKSPGAIAIATAAQLVAVLQRDLVAATDVEGHAVQGSDAQSEDAPGGDADDDDVAGDHVRSDDVEAAR